MENNQIQQPQQPLPEHEKPHKSRRWIIANIYYYIIGANLVAWGAGKIIIEPLFGIEGFLLGTIIISVLSLLIIWFAIRGGVEKIFKESVVLSKDFLKISIFVALIPPVINFLLSLFIILANSGVALLIASALSTYAAMSTYAAICLLSGIFYGIAVYFWFRKSALSAPDHELPQKVRSIPVVAFIIAGITLLVHILLMALLAGLIVIFTRQQFFIATGPHRIPPSDTTKTEDVTPVELPGVGEGIGQDETANWETYRNDIYGYKFSIAPSAEGEVQSNSYGKEANEAANITLFLGEKGSDTGNSFKVWAFKEGGNASGLQRLSGINDYLDVKKVAEAIWRINKEDTNPNFPDKRVGNFQEFTFEGEAAYKFSLTRSYGNVTGGYVLDRENIILYVKHGNILYELIYPAYSTSAAQILSTFKFTR